MIACSANDYGKTIKLRYLILIEKPTPAQGIIDEFQKAKQEVADSPSTIPIWQTTVSKYPPTFIGECKLAVKWSGELVTEWLSPKYAVGQKYRPEVESIVNQLFIMIILNHIVIV